MIRKFCSVIALISFLLIGTMSASASEWVNIDDYDPNAKEVLTVMSEIAEENNFNVYNVNIYIKDGIRYAEANFGKNKKNIIKFQLNNEGIKWAIISGYYNDIKDFDIVFDQIDSLFAVIYHDLIIDSNEQEKFEKKIINEFVSSIYDIRKKIRNNEYYNPIVDVQGNLYSSADERYYNIRYYIDFNKNLLYISIKAYR